MTPADSRQERKLVQATGAPPGTFTITAVEPERMRASEAGIPFGRLRDENRYQSLADGKIRVIKRIEV